MVGKPTGPQLVGRAGERAALFAAWERAMSGSAAAVVISGEAGIGKSRLAAELVRHVEAAGYRVLSGACAALGEGAMPYAPIVEALHRLRGRSRLSLLEIAGTTLPAGGRDERAGPGDPLGRARVFAAIMDTLERVAASRPTLLLLEDLHWAGQSTLELVAYLARNAPSRLLPVVTFRPESPTDRLAALAAELTRLPGTERIDLAPMTEAELASLIEAMLEARPNPALVADIHTRSGGNPFLAEELVTAVLRGEATSLPARLHGVLMARLVDVSASDVEMLRAAAVLGPSSDAPRLRRVGGLATVAARNALHDLEGRGLLVRHTGAPATWAFRHDLMREAVYLSILQDERLRLHARAARALSARSATRPGSRIGEIAEHWQQAGRPDLAIPYQALAGDAALALFAFEEAADWYGRAIVAAESSTRQPSEERPSLASLLARRAEALAMRGDIVGAEAAGERATRLLDAEGASVDAFLLRARRAHWLWLNSQEAAAKRLWDQMKSEDVTAEMAASPQVLAVVARLVHQDPAAWSESAEYAERAAEGARQAGLPAVEADALIWLGMSLVQIDRVDEGLAALRRATALAAGERNIELYRYASHLLVAVLGEAERFDEAIEAGEHQVAMVNELRLEPRVREPILSNYRDALAWMGRWEQVLSEVETALRFDITDGARCDLLLLRSQIALARGDTARAAADLDEATTLGRGRVQESHVGTIGLLRAELALLEGRTAAAAAIVDGVLDAVEATGDAREGMFHDLILLGMRIEAARASGGGSRAVGRSPAPPGPTSRDRAAALLSRLRRRRSNRIRSYTLFPRQVATTFLQARGEARGMDGRPAPDLWSRAADGWSELRRPAAEAYARLRLGQALVEDGDRSAAAATLAGARRIAAGLGARTILDEIDAMARTEGLSDAILAVAAGSDTNRLTPRETEVLRLITVGWSNKEIGSELGISEKTAEVHVSNLLRKLGVERRVEAAMLAVQRGLVAPHQLAPARPAPLLRDDAEPAVHR